MCALIKFNGAVSPLYNQNIYVAAYVANGGKDEAEVELSGLLNEEKVDMGNAKVDIENEKVDIESVLSEKDSNFSVKTTVHIHRLFCECYPNSWPQEMREV